VRPMEVVVLLWMVHEGSAVVALPNTAFLPTVGWALVAGWGVGGPQLGVQADRELLGLDLVLVARAALVAKPAARSRTPRRSAVRREVCT
jgi:hypothetical protein